MSNGEGPKKRDSWDRADVIGKLLIPVIIAAATISFNYSQKIGEARQKTFETAIDILKSPKSPDTEQLRSWALGVLQTETQQASAELPKAAIQELQKGALPSASALRLPNPGQVRVAIIRLQGTANEPAEKLKSALTSAGYTDVSIREETQGLFPSKAEVRFYYPADSVNAQALSEYINRTLSLPIEVNPRSQDRDTSNHRLGDLHVYIR
jgi:hypothetical protein